MKLIGVMTRVLPYQSSSGDGDDWLGDYAHT